MIVQLSQAHNHKKYDNNEKGWYFQSDVENKINIEYILLII